MGKLLHMSTIVSEVWNKVCRIRTYYAFHYRQLEVLCLFLVDTATFFFASYPEAFKLGTEP
jgi:hypothetical protein